MIVKISKSDWENIGKVNGWIKSSQSKPRVLLIELKGMWDISEDDLSNLKSICDLDWVQVDSDKMDEEDLAAKCEGYDHLMLNMDFLPSFPDKMDLSMRLLDCRSWRLRLLSIGCSLRLESGGLPLLLMSGSSSWRNCLTTRLGSVRQLSSGGS